MDKGCFTKKLWLWSLMFPVIVCSCNPNRYNFLSDMQRIKRGTRIPYASHIPKIEPGHELCISINSLNKEGTTYFRGSREREGATGIECLTFLVNEKGFINLPLVGSFKISGLSIQQSQDSIAGVLQKYLRDPTVKVRFENYSVSVLGDVNLPGVYTVDDGRITILDALAMARDVTQFADRKNMLITRELPNKVAYTRIDMTTKDLYKSPYFNLKSGDVIYVPSNKGRIANSKNLLEFGSIIIGTLTLVAIIVTR